MSATIQLTVHDPAGKSREIVVEKFPYTIGRLGDNDLLLRDNRISRRQAQIIEEENQFYVEDNESRHGTFVNGERIQRHRLQPNDRIEFGVNECFVLVFSSDQPDVGKLLDRFRVSSEQTSSAGELHQLNAMLEVSRVLNAGLALDDVLTQVVDSCLQIAQAERGLLLLKDDQGKLEFRVARDRQRSTLSGKNLRISKTVVDRAMETRRHVIHMDAAGEAGATLPAAGNSIADLELRTLICLPLMRMQVTTASETTSYGSAADVIGVLYMDSRLPTSSFSDTSREVLQTLCLEASTVVENAKLFALSRDREKLEQELKIARNIQQKLLPRKFPQGLAFEVTGMNVACQQVGGDYFDVFELADGCCGVVIADVSGKGITAALLASMLQGVFWATATSGRPPGETARRVNEYVCERSTPDKYATLFYAVLDPAGTLTYVNAGHNPPMLVRASGRVDPLVSENLPIGMFTEAGYTESRVDIGVGDTLVLYTDGVTEAVNTDDEMYGEERLSSFLAPCCGQELEQVRDRLLQAVKAFTLGQAQNDDITVVVARHR